jgi:hypothetical protein
MGHSSYSDDFYRSRVSCRVERGLPTFAYSDSVTKGDLPKKAHDSLGILGKIRESRDSVEHPESTAIGVIFDVTGSMRSVPVKMQSKLPKLMGLLLRKGYIKDPQVLFGAVGDYFADNVALQMGQFESGIEMDDNLTNVYLEGGGGGSYEESYQNAMYYFAHKTSCDCWEKRGKKGYLFLIGDEKPYSKSTKEELKTLIDENSQGDADLASIVSAVKEKFNVFFIIPNNTSHFGDPVLKERWAGLLGEQNVIMLEDPDAVCETIGLAIGLCEGTATRDGIRADLTDIGTGSSIVNATTKALDLLGKSAALTKGDRTGAVALDLPSKQNRSSKTERL